VLFQWCRKLLQCHATPACVHSGQDAPSTLSGSVRADVSEGDFDNAVGRHKKAVTASQLAAAKQLLLIQNGRKL